MTDGAERCPHSGNSAAIDFTMADPEILSIGRPHEYYRRLRDNDRVHFDAKINTWLVSRYEDVEEVLRDAITFSQEEGWKAQFAQGYLDELKTILERDGGGWFPEVLL